MSDVTRWPLGVFRGEPILTWLGPLRYQLVPGRLTFARSTGEIVTPNEIVTDGGSIPRLAWSLPGLDPWTYLPAYLIHDWEFQQHHRGLGAKSFEDVNDTLAEGILTLMASGIVPADHVRAHLIHAAVSSAIGRGVWDRGLSGLANIGPLT